MSEKFKHDLAAFGCLVFTIMLFVMASVGISFTLGVIGDWWTEQPIGNDCESAQQNVRAGLTPRPDDAMLIRRVRYPEREFHARIGKGLDALEGYQIADWEKQGKHNG